MLKARAWARGTRTRRSDGLIIALLIVMVDQLSKYGSHLYLERASIRVFRGFDLILSHNPGAAFSFLADASGWQRWFLSALAVGMSLAIYQWLGRLDAHEKQESLALSLILGGALGNLIDRLCYGHVIDFIVFYYRQWAWPAFNIADAAISLGMILWFLGCFKKTNKH